MTKPACFQEKNFENTSRIVCKKNNRKNPQICAKLRKSGFVNFLDSFVSGHSILIPWVEGCTFNNLQSLVQAGQILPWESIRKWWLDDTFARCALQGVLFRLKLVLKLSASKCNCITVISVWRALSTITKCLRRSITWGNNRQVRHDKNWFVVTCPVIFFAGNIQFSQKQFK